MKVCSDRSVFASQIATLPVVLPTAIVRLSWLIASVQAPRKGSVSIAWNDGGKLRFGTHTSHGKAKVMYVLKGMVYAYTAFDSTTSTPGSGTIDLNHSNRHGKLLLGQTITISTGAKTTLLLENGVTSVAAAQAGDVGTVKIRASRLAFKSATLADVQNALTNQPAFQIIDKGPASS